MYVFNINNSKRSGQEPFRTPIYEKTAATSCDLPGLSFSFLTYRWWVNSRGAARENVVLVKADTWGLFCMQRNRRVICPKEVLVPVKERKTSAETRGNRSGEDGREGDLGEGDGDQ